MARKKKQPEKSEVLSPEEWKRLPHYIDKDGRERTQWYGGMFRDNLPIFHSCPVEQTAEEKREVDEAIAQFWERAIAEVLKQRQEEKQWEPQDTEPG